MAGIRIRHWRAASLLAAMVMAATGPVFAYTPEQEQACTGDAFRLCNAEIPDVDRVTACMIRNKAQLSPACRTQFGPDPRETIDDASAGRPMNIRAAKPKKPVKAKAIKTRKSMTS
jgi:hypothetical protein